MIASSEKATVMSVTSSFEFYTSKAKPLRVTWTSWNTRHARFSRWRRWRWPHAVNRTMLLAVYAPVFHVARSDRAARRTRYTYSHHSDDLSELSSSAQMLSCVGVFRRRLVLLVCVEGIGQRVQRQVDEGSDRCYLQG